MKDFFENMLMDFLDTGIPAVLIFCGLIYVLFTHPIWIVYGLAFFGVYAIVQAIYVAFNMFNP